MKIYTRTGDAGETGLFGGRRVPKDDVRVEAYGTIDELNAALGMVRATPISPRLEDVLRALQADLFTLGAELSCVPGHESRLGIPLLDQEDVERLERTIDEAETALPPLKTFILPAGSASAASLHLARTVARRAERRVLTLSRHESVRSQVFVYLNRLADLLFVLARLAHHEAGRDDEPWAPRARSRTPSE